MYIRKTYKIVIFCIIFTIIGNIMSGIVIATDNLATDNLATDNLATDNLATDKDVIIGFNVPVGISEKALIKNNGGTVKQSFSLIPAVSAKVSERNLAKIKRDSRVAYIEDDKIFDMASSEYVSSYGTRIIGSETVHSRGIVGTGVKIAILDTGIDYNHVDLLDNYKGGIGFVEDTNGAVNPNNFDDSYNSHGTHVAGIIAAKDNGVGIIGVAPNASIYALKVLDGSGSGKASWIIAGLSWAVDNHMDIATMSIQMRECISDCPPGYNEGLQSLQNAVDNAYKSGLLLVAAGGNSNGGSVRYPAAYDSVIGVTAINNTYSKASFSPIGSEVELSAPGVDINSTTKGSAEYVYGYGLKSGTSMAAPHVTGAAALIMSSNAFVDINNDGITNNTDVRLILQNSAYDIGDSGKDDIYGYGIVDVPKAILGDEYTAYEPVDLSITKDDNVSNVIASEVAVVESSEYGFRSSIKYRYNITVKNNGPGDAYNVKVSDIWPPGFVRIGEFGGIGSGYCVPNGLMNFVCNIEKIASNDVKIITVDYYVPLNTFEYMNTNTYSNDVSVLSENIEPNRYNNDAIDINILSTAQINLIRTKGSGSPDNDLKKINMSQGKYMIYIHSNNLSQVNMKIYDNGKYRKDLSREYIFNNKVRDVNFELNVTSQYGNMLEADFIPYGDRGTTGYLTITRS